jgi:5-methylcytosine-specific restriction endonuclease McrA
MSRGNPDSFVNADRGSYAEYLRSDLWKTIRDGALYRAQYRCQSPTCRRAELRSWTEEEIRQGCWGTYRLEVHHLTYERVGGRELPDDLIVLCDECHDIAHGFEPEPWRASIERAVIGAINAAVRSFCRRGRE